MILPRARKARALKKATESCIWLLVICLLVVSIDGILETEERCPEACNRQGVCTRVGCTCYHGYSGDACDLKSSEGAEATHGFYRDRGYAKHAETRSICVVSAQVPHTSINDDVEMVIPGTQLAKQLASRGHVVTLLFLKEDGPHAVTDKWARDLVRNDDVHLVVLYQSQHFYMPSMVSQSFEVYGWLSDRVHFHGAKPFDLIVLHGSHGLGYYLGLARGQNPRTSGTEGTVVLTYLEASYLWLTLEGSGTGVTSVDDIEVDFVEKEAIRMADGALVSFRGMLSWCQERGWRFPADTMVSGTAEMEGTHRPARSKPARAISSEWQMLALGDDATAVGGTSSSGAAETARRSLVIVLQGPGGGQQGEMISSGGHMRAQGHFKVSKAQQFDTLERDIQLMKQLFEALSEDELSAKIQRVTLVIAGIEYKNLLYYIKSEVSGISLALGKGREVKVERKVLSYTEAEAFVSETNPDDIHVTFCSLHRGLSTFPWIKRIFRMNKTNSIFFSSSEGTREMISEMGDGDYLLTESVDATVAAILGLLHGQPEPASKRATQDSVSGDNLADADKEEALEIMELFDDVLHRRSILPERLKDAMASSSSMNVVRLAGHESRAHQSGSSPFRSDFLQMTTLPTVSVVITHYNRPDFLRQAIRSVVHQSYPADLLELIVIDDGSPNEGIREKLEELHEEFRFAERGWRIMYEPNRYLGGARNAGAEYAKGKYILFMDDDNYAKSFEVQRFVHAMENTHADILTSGVDFIRGDAEPVGDSCFAVQNETKCVHKEGKLRGGSGNGRSSPSFVFLGSSSNVGLFKNCYGDANSFFRKESFQALGGYTTDKHVGYEDWELYSKASLGGYVHQLLPRAMYFYRFTPGSMQKTTSYRKSRFRALRAYLEADLAT